MRKLILVASVVILSSTVNSQEKQVNYNEALELIEVWLDAQRDYDRVPGMSVAIINDQDILWSSAFGMANLEDQVKASPSTLYSICSISKLFTAVAIMKLCDEEKLRLDDRIEDLLPWYNLKQQYPDSWPVTIRTLLTHSSGLPRESNHPYWTGPDFPFPEKEEIRSELSQQETLYPSSTWFQYSNLGFTLLGEVVEEVSGLAYEDYIKQHILEPLNLENTRTFLPEELYGNELAVGYSTILRDGSREKVNLFQARGIKAAAGFSSSVTDLGKFASWQFRLMDTTLTEVLKPSTLNYMQNVHWTDPDWKNTWGLGFWVIKGPDGKKWVEHSGGCPGYTTLFSMLPDEKRAYAVFTNAWGTKRTEYVRGMNKILDKYVADQDKKKDAEKVPGLDEYEGYYSLLPHLSELYITSWNQKLALLKLPTLDPAGSMMVLKHVREDTFRRVRENGELAESYVFERDDKGSVYRIKSHQNFYSKIDLQQ